MYGTTERQGEKGLPRNNSPPPSRSPTGLLVSVMGFFMFGMLGVVILLPRGAPVAALEGAPRHQHLVDNKNLDLPEEVSDLTMYAGFVPTNLEKPELGENLVMTHNYLFISLFLYSDSSLRSSLLFTSFSLDSHLFYWMLKSQTEGPKPLVIWLNGGPGASSLTGVLLELGPFLLERSGKLKYNEFGWTQKAHVVAIDNPVGAGFSYTSSEEVDEEGYVNSLGEMAEQLYTGILGIVDLHPWLKDSPIFIAGER